MGYRPCTFKTLLYVLLMKCCGQPHAAVYMCKLQKDGHILLGAGKKPLLYWLWKHSLTYLILYWLSAHLCLNKLQRNSPPKIGKRQIHWQKNLFSSVCTRSRTTGFLAVLAFSLGGGQAAGWGTHTEMLQCGRCMRLCSGTSVLMGHVEKIPKSRINMMGFKSPWKYFNYYF